MGASGGHGCKSDMEDLGGRMTEAKILQIKKEKNNTQFSCEFIEYVDKEWQEITKRLKKCRYDLSKIQIVSVNRMA